MEKQTSIKFVIKLVVIFMLLNGGIYCDTEIESKGTAGKDIDGQTLIEMGRRLNKPILTILGMAITNLHRCSEWTQWTECDVTREYYFGTRNRSRECELDKASSGKARKEETDLGICEGGVEGKGFCRKDYNMTTNGFCIKLYVTPKYHDDAEMVCQEDGGFLINIDSDLKYADVKSILNGFLTNVNIGGRRKDSTSQWEYKYGSSSGYFKWFSSSYPMKIDSYLCLAMQNYLWYNLSCSTKFPFLCEIPV
ncbi:uncharacterized protein LOC123534898 [Mercenaria mercenaria]|uniref:uncharacterized protein LOC123534898 n=1 Tax=Mercenaria mercenaria TaxID=6596 RepID=UPI00234EB156|nr:uncharacterized protein LOC123534898 [Mercenaria mercenaria]